MALAAVALEAWGLLELTKPQSPHALFRLGVHGLGFRGLGFGLHASGFEVLRVALGRRSSSQAV